MFPWHTRFGAGVNRNWWTLVGSEKSSSCSSQLCLYCLGTLTCHSIKCERMRENGKCNNVECPSLATQPPTQPPQHQIGQVYSPHPKTCEANHSNKNRLSIWQVKKMYFFFKLLTVGVIEKSWSDWFVRSIKTTFSKDLIMIVAITLMIRIPLITKK